jgi:predicted TIM-barrel fold metal-dependent hydrolase
MATTLSVLNMVAGCGDDKGMLSRDTVEDHMKDVDAGERGESSRSNMATTSKSSGSEGGFAVGGDMCLNQAMADKLLRSQYFILDFQTHHTNEGQAGLCLTEENPDADCTSPSTYLRQIFEESETTVAVLSGLPAEIDEVTMDLSAFSFTNQNMRDSRDRVNKAAKLNDNAGERMVAHCQISPKNKPEANEAMMRENKEKYDTRGWKCYPPTEGGWFLHENDAFIQTAIELNEPLVCAHKGFPFQGWSRVHANPMPDVGVVAKRYPDVNFVIYHSAFDSGHEEGPYVEDPDPDDGGSDRLSKVILDNGLTNKNVYAEMGSAWCIVMRDPMQAQHYIGKMLKNMGEDRLVWGSECVWFGCPQNQIEAFKAFRISDELREKHGYPEFTDAIRRKVFGLTGSKLYRVDPELCRYKVTRDILAMRKQRLDDRWGDRRHAYNPPVIRSFEKYRQIWRDRLARGEIA